MPAEAKTYSPDGFPVFALAACSDHLEVAEYLFGRGADVNAAATNGTEYNALTGAVAVATRDRIVALDQWRLTRLPLRKRLLAAYHSPPQMATWEL